MENTPLKRADPEEEAAKPQWGCSKEITAAQPRIKDMDADRECTYDTVVCDRGRRSARKICAPKQLSLIHI